MKKNLNIDMKIINIIATNREALTRKVMSKIDSESLNKLLKRDPEFTLLHIVRNDCGCDFSYKTELDIPSESVVCKHGNEVIRYTD